MIAIPDLSWLVRALGAVAFASFLGGCGILVVLGLRTVWGRRLAPGWRCLLWLPVALLCVMPRLPDFGLSVSEQFEGTDPPMGTTFTKVTSSPLFHSVEIPSGTSIGAAHLSPPKHVLTPTEWIALTWALGSLMLLVVGMVGYGMMWRRMVRLAESAPESIIQLYLRCCETMKLRNAPPLLMTRAIQSPAVAGLFRPTVLLPAKFGEMLDEEALQHVLLHEAGHVKRRDLAWHWLSAMLVAVHWPNPLVWWAARLFRGDREAACDAAVLATCSEDARQTYGGTLLKLQACLGSYQLSRTTLGVLGGADMLRRRILDIAHFGRRSSFAGWSAGALVVILAAGLAALAGEPTPQRDGTAALVANINQKRAGGVSQTPLSSREMTLQEIDRLAGAEERQITLSTKIVQVDGNGADVLEQLLSQGKSAEKPVNGSSDKPSNRGPNAFSVTGVLSEPQLQELWPRLTQRKDVSVIAMPQVTTKSGQTASVEIQREMRYPTEYAPPQIPKAAADKVPDEGAAPAITPTTPVAFESRPVGLRLKVSPILEADGRVIDLMLDPEFTIFEGFINYGSPILGTARDALGNATTVTLSPNKILQPVFATNKVTTSVSIWEGNTLVMGGFKVPASFMGDGKVQPDQDEKKTRSLLLFLTAKLVDPTGKAKPDANGQLPPPSPGIVLADVDVSGMKLDEALRHIAELCRKADPRVGSPGINLLLRHPEVEPPRVSLHLRQVRISELLNQLAIVSGLDLQVEGNAVLLAPAPKAKKADAVPRK